MAFRKALDGGRADLVHLNPSLTARSLLRDGLFIRRVRRDGLPVLVHIHGWEEHTADRIDRGPLRWFFERTLAGGDAYVVLAEEFAERLRSWGIRAPVHQGTTAVGDELLDGFDMERKLEAFSSDATLRLLFLARIERDKGVYETIDACAELLNEGLGIHLTIAGDGSELENVRRVAATKLGGSVEFPGFILGDRKAEAFRRSHVYVLPTSHAEGMPASVLEAMALGLPVITRAMGGLRDFFADGEHGYLMKSTDSGELASLIRKLATDASLWRRVSAGAHEYAVGRFLGSKVAAHLVGIYRSILGGET
jgi:glycosyltransferase involved in cell wall biosynthesis